MNDNRRPMSPFGKMLFEVATSYNQVILTDSPESVEPGNPHKRIRPFVIDPIKRPSRKQENDK